MTTFLKLSAVVLSGALVLSGCSVFRVYTIDLPQGTPITSAQASQVRVGMTADQVTYLLGSPAIKDTLNPDRFDYLYDYTAGTDGKRAGKKNIKNASQYMSIYFENGRVVRIAGRETLPLKNQ
ncbi:MAG: outer membrane protein assembly factor BamE [Moraxella sp.]|uniref:outer membrane protein assembly factor BamE n=1 Tax=Moraxella sp. TaxID=479 RepID=UPI0026DA8755|nr:outer membrane protein assembly factor BamE [Moraxella sp.]MDO4450323.1 outer membrane protein assembly factor BamE [Moraxella sp.]